MFLAALSVLRSISRAYGLRHRRVRCGHSQPAAARRRARIRRAARYGPSSSWMMRPPSSRSIRSVPVSTSGAGRSPGAGSLSSARADTGVADTGPTERADTARTDAARTDAGLADAGLADAARDDSGRAEVPRALACCCGRPVAPPRPGSAARAVGPGVLASLGEPGSSSAGAAAAGRSAGRGEYAGPGPGSAEPPVPTEVLIVGVTPNRSDRTWLRSLS